jgi:hypothetical protein
MSVMPITYASDPLLAVPPRFFRTSTPLLNRLFRPFPGVTRLGALARLVVIAPPAGVKLLASLTEFGSHSTPLFRLLDTYSLPLQRFHIPCYVVEPYCTQVLIPFNVVKDRTPDWHFEIHAPMWIVPARR